MQPHSLQGCFTWPPLLTPARHSPDPDAGSSFPSKAAAYKHPSAPPRNQNPCCSLSPSERAARVPSKPHKYRSCTRCRCERGLTRAELQLRRLSLSPLGLAGDTSGPAVHCITPYRSCMSITAGSGGFCDVQHRAVSCWETLLLLKLTPEFPFASQGAGFSPRAHCSAEILLRSGEEAELCLYLYMRTYIHVCISMDTHVCIYMYMCMSICMYYRCFCICAYIHIHVCV